ncbi:alpha/beta-hydrolase [Cylindrobasidium torrendii FP15055 ss-10]|uniref:Palmitoyl-protein thioesterase 1 n=1 Tax=Cylindrobasidium torrendii FP15055 ss-10 TaxID=1314674 RepID=A0A0D7B9X8_9AGAR|nr:alpha/beta-hydrolase [Cylindrobasidium torrendii FP15055 ss-10]
MKLSRLFGACCTLLSVSALAVKSPRPLVIWHGLGDSYASEGIVEFGKLIEEIHPGIFIHSVYIVDNNDDDRKATFYGNINTQLEFVAEQLQNVTELAGGFDAIGFSQGGQFLRAYVERFNDPPIHNLITFGSQHMGVSDLPACSAWDFPCKAARNIARGAVYGHWVQKNIIMAQYYRDPAHMETYLEANHFLPDINNEREERNATYAENFVTLNALVLMIFDEDQTVVPKESAWFGSEAVLKKDGYFSPENQQVLDSNSDISSIAPTLVHMRQQPLYKEDWIGLRTLDERGAVVFGTCHGQHMQIKRECWEPLVRKWVGGVE